MKNNISNYAIHIQEYVSNLSIQHLQVFCNLNCEKLLPAYKLFSEFENFGDVSSFSKIIEEVYISQFTKSDIIEVEIMEKGLDENFFNLEEFEAPLASYAFDTCEAFDELLQFLKFDDAIHILNNAQVCINSVDMFVQQKDNIDYITDMNQLEELISKNEWMIKEKTRQLVLLEELSSLSDLDDSSIENLRKINNSFGQLVDLRFIVEQ